MASNFFQVPIELITSYAEATAQGQNTQISNLLLENPAPTVPTTNSTLSAAQLEQLITAIDQHYESATDVARRWLVGAPDLGTPAVNDQVIGVMNDFIRFSNHMSTEYDDLIEAAYNKDEATLRDKLGRLRGLLEELKSGIRPVPAAITQYQEDLSNAQKNFNADYDRVMSSIGVVADKIHALGAAIGTLEQDIASNNREVLDTAIATASTGLEQGVNLAASVAKEDAAGAITAGVTMGIAVIKAGVKTLEVNAKTLNDIREIRRISGEISEDQLVMTALLNIGTMLSSLGGVHGLEMSFVSSISDYWSGMDTGIESLLATSGDLSSKINTVNYNPSTKKFRNPRFPPWNVIMPIEKAAAAFQLILDLRPQTFGNNVQYEKIHDPQT